MWPYIVDDDSPPEQKFRDAYYKSTRGGGGEGEGKEATFCFLSAIIESYHLNALYIDLN